ncbi:hypothetical protein C8J57DRAFT_1198216 [Mycena rebaudengoi]|nr:hypothetical protein C8J57DRAFT_1198216 [Mycena rebaudengoi]
MTVDILILGAGWTSTFLIPLCLKSQIICAATTRSGSGSTIPFEFQPLSDDLEPYKRLPNAKTVLITFPITVSGASERLVRMYSSTRAEKMESPSAFIQLGTTSIWDKSPEALLEGVVFYDRKSPFIVTNRSSAEVELLALSSFAPTTVLNLAGLCGGQRLPRNWLARVAPTKETLKIKGGLHLIHGLDLARAILAVHSDFAKAAGQRWIITDLRVYDWWELASAWDIPSSPDAGGKSSGVEERPASWVRDFMLEENVRVLPRSTGSLSPVIDSRDFWYEFRLSPQTRL